MSQLAGEWYGEYSSGETGRSGSIVFKLTAGSDTATGDVIMIPQVRMRPPAGQGQQPGGPAPSSGIQALTINFVRVSGGQVSGALAAYTDPECNCPLHTTFVGRLHGDTLSGSYTSRHEQSRDAQRGQWLVVRQRRAP